MNPAAYYDRIYAAKDYRAEVDRLLAQLLPVTPDSSLLDVACGTGRHLEHLQDHYNVVGLDLDEAMLLQARARNPGVMFYRGDMVEFDLGAEFDVVTCLFSSIGYVVTLDRLRQALGCFRRHVRPGGVLVLEPWLTPEAWQPQSVYTHVVDSNGVRLARISTGFSDGRVSVFSLHYLMATPEGTEYAVEHHEQGLFSDADMRAALHDAGFENVASEAFGLTGRGLYTCRLDQMSRS